MYPHDHKDYEGFWGYAEQRDVYELRPNRYPKWEVSFYDSLHSVDGLVLIGGGASTLIAGLTSIPERKPMVAIDAFGGSASTVWNLLSPENHIATAGQIELMAQPWSQDMATALVACLAEQMGRRDELEREQRVQANVPKDRENGNRIAWLSDIHIAREGDVKPLLHKGLIPFFRNKGSRLAQEFPLGNLKTILAEIQKIKPDHILVTGDLTNFGLSHQFQSLRELFLVAQQVIKPKAPADELDSNLWTILPGNHDVTEEGHANCQTRKNLGLFFKYFKDSYPCRQDDYDNIFPLRRTVPRKSPDGNDVVLWGLDSTVKYPVSRVGINARGKVDEPQINELQLHLPKTKPSDTTVLVALHHHPIVVPHIVSDLQEWFLSMNEADGRNFVKLCANTGVSAVLHGHFHSFSYWTVLTPEDNRQMAIIGSPSSTLADDCVQFLELREAWRESSWGLVNGLALYRHVFKQRQWTEDYVAFVE
jgi:3',5'-cyclic AMP phosphodiesterase CpdA